MKVATSHLIHTVRISSVVIGSKLPQDLHVEGRKESDDAVI